MAIANDPNPALRVEIEAAINNLVPQLRGLQYFAQMAQSSDATLVIQSESSVRQRRFNLLNAVIAALDAVVADINALYADGYPTFQPNGGAQAAFAEIATEEADLIIAANLFKAGDVSIGLDLVNVIHTPQPLPRS